MTAGNEYLMHEAGLSWRFVDGDRDLTGTPHAERDASQAQLLTEDAAVLLELYRPAAEQLWQPTSSECLSPEAMHNLQAVRQLDELDIGALLDMETEYTDLPDATRWTASV